MRTIEKEWGITRCIFRNDTTEVWHASIRAGGKSSMHKHERKVNRFYVLSGDLIVRSILGEVDLHAGHSFTVDSGQWHQFEAINDVELIETYWLDPIDEMDIVRQPQEVTSGQ